MNSSIHWCRNIRGERKVLKIGRFVNVICKDPFSYNIEVSEWFGKEGVLFFIEFFNFDPSFDYVCIDSYYARRF
jgi:hypothetical protein